MADNHSPADSSEGHTRKRVCKACDRCRLKKSKCDGASPCGRCKADNAICVFGERKKSHDKVYPKGYVEMLEQQQTQLVSGLRELYRRLEAGGSWQGAPLQDGPSGFPLTHDILQRLDLLYSSGDNGSPTEPFEEDFSKMQQKLLNSGAGYMRRRGSVSSDSDHDHGHASPPTSGIDSPESQSLSYPEIRHGAPPTPPMDSPLHQQSGFQPVSKTLLPTGVPNKERIDPASALQSTFGIMPVLEDTAMMDCISPFDASFGWDTPLYEPFMMGTEAATPMATSVWPDSCEVEFNKYVD